MFISNKFYSNILLLLLLLLIYSHFCDWGLASVLLEAMGVFGWTFRPPVVRGWRGSVVLWVYGYDVVRCGSADIVEVYRSILVNWPPLEVATGHCL